MSHKGRIGRRTVSAGLEVASRCSSHRHSGTSEWQGRLKLPPCPCCGKSCEATNLLQALSDPNRRDFESQSASDCSRNSRNHCDSENTLISLRCLREKLATSKLRLQSLQRFMIAIAWVTKHKPQKHRKFSKIGKSRSKVGLQEIQKVGRTKGRE